MKCKGTGENQGAFWDNLSVNVPEQLWDGSPIVVGHSES